MPETRQFILHDIERENAGAAIPAEVKEKSFEQARQELIDFLNTRYHDLIKKTGKAETAEQPFYWEVLGVLKQKFRACIRTDAKQAVELIKNLLTSDRSDGSNMPPLFTQSREEFKDNAKDRQSPEGWDRDEEEYSRDIFERVVEGDVRHSVFNDTLPQTTYRTFYYAAIIEALGSVKSPEAEQALVECLQEIDSFEYHQELVEKDGKQFFEDKLIKKGKETFLESGQRKKEETDQNTEARENEIAAMRGDDFSDYAQWFPSLGYRFIDEVELALPTLAAYKSFGNQEDLQSQTLKYLVERIYKNDWSVKETFFPLLELFNKYPARVGKYLMEKLQQEPDEYYKVLISRILYHLEFGKISMSEAGVEYLGKQYDLGAHNNSRHFAHRVTADGQIGIFDEEQKAIGHFQLHGLDSPEQKLKAEVLQFGYETLFYPKTDETVAERAERENILEEFKAKYFQTYLTDFNKETGVMFNNLSFREQGWFLWYVQQASEKDKKRALEFIKTYREDGFKTFLSLEQDKNNGDKILLLGERLERRVAETIFAKYGELIRTAGTVVNYVSDKFGPGKISADDHQQIIDGLLARGKKLLADYAEQARHVGIDEPDLSEKILADLAIVRSDVILFARTFKIASEKQNINFNDIKGVALEHKDSAKLTRQEKAALTEIFLANRRSNPTAYPPALLKKRKKEFADLLQEPGKKFYLLRDGETVVAFVHYEDKQDAHGPARYLGSFNVDPNGRGQKIGTAFLQSTLAAEGLGRRVILNVNGNNPYLKTYLTALGFRVEHVEQNYRESGIPYYFLERLPPSQRSAAPEANQRAAA